MYKNALKEDLIRVDEDLDGTVESHDTIAKLKTKIENSSTFESDPDFVKTLIKNCIDERARTYINLLQRLTANFQYYCSLRKVNSFESLCDLIISDKLFETLISETATHIGIREAEDWFRPTDLAKECDIYISSRSGSHKEIPITYGYTQDPFKNRSRNLNQRLKRTIPNYLERENKIALYAVIASHYARDCSFCLFCLFLYVSDSPLVSMKKEKGTYRCGQRTVRLADYGMQPAKQSSRAGAAMKQKLKLLDCELLKETAERTTERWDASDHPQRSLPLNWGGTDPNCTVICMVLKASANDRRHLALCPDEFRGPRSGLCRSGGISNNYNNTMERGTLTQSSAGGTQGSAEDHIYAEIGDIQNTTAPTNDDSIYTELVPSDEYEKPKSASQDTIYTEILPTESDYEEPIKGSKDDHIYSEIRPTENDYEEPIKGSKDDHIYSEIRPAENDYEEPIKGSKDDHIYSEIRPAESDYEEPIKGSKDDHIYTDVIPSESDYEEPRKGSKDNIYTEVIPSESDYEEPRKGSKDNIYTEVIPSEHEYEAIQEPEESNESQQSPSESRSSQSQTPRPRTSKDYYETPVTNQSSDSAYPVFITKRYPRSLERTTSSGFQPWLPTVQKPKEKVEKSEYEELAEIILKTSKSETNYQDSSKLPNLEEMGYDVETLSELIKALSKRSKSSEKSREEKDTTKNQNVRDRRHNSESLPKAPKKSSSAKEKSINTIRNKHLKNLNNKVGYKGEKPTR
ncbi:uncharacterized protein TNCV_4886811 [Trichonephila clavipes]|uniref:Uncharacterized protein n=1 Tax=Trichonephila clavipes TaxID=2585209 RepID=A0A8X6RKB4_TRICX|nr:uncharacterized protein TNCV_4886811 [Trichonephila clavipes]